MLYYLWSTFLLPSKSFLGFESALFRATLAVMFGFAIVTALGPRVIRTLIKLKIGDRPEFDHATLNQLTAGKQNTPTMGGILIVFAIFVTTLLLTNLANFYVKLALFCIVWLACLGGVDDWLKLTAGRRSGTRDGLRTWEKLMFQFALGMILALFVYRTGKANMETDRWMKADAPYTPYYNVLNIPFNKGPEVGPTLIIDGKEHRFRGVVLPIGVFAVIAVLVIAGTSNAVNLTDGMDGLASGCLVMTSFVFMVFAAVVGSAELSSRLLFYHVPGSGELSVVCGAALGACLGFLWFNAYPAQVFMGDTGSLALGGLIGYVAIVTRLELMLVIVGGVFVIEALSVLIQIFYFKRTGGKRFFRCAPIHHHFHLGGWTETQTVTRFWLVGALFAAFALATIKLR